MGGMSWTFALDALGTLRVCEGAAGAHTAEVLGSFRPGRVISRSSGAVQVVLRREPYAAG